MYVSGLRLLRDGNVYTLAGLEPQEATYVMQNPRNNRLLRLHFGISAMELQVKFCHGDMNASSRKHP